MMEVPHGDLLKKIEGRKDRKGYIQILNEGQMSVVDFFYKSSYLDAKGEERPCYEVTRLGCDFLANKSTGEKGVIFTARYVKRFQEMENQVKKIPAWQIPVGEVASYLKAMDRVAVRQNLAPYKIAEAFKVVSERFGIMLPADFVRIPEYEQMEMEL